ncbi:RNI-like protein [Dentipellis sp. KUC8613]|nr:RNI-like protein [Dentipellis sp. KUC8613]
MLATKQPRSLALSLASRGHVDCSDRGWAGANGARSVIETITGRRFVTRLLLGHNQLGDDGCEVLCDFLCSEEGQKYRVEEISLNSNDIGDRGLRALARYLRGNTSLRDLFLQNNCFTADPDIILLFSAAVSSSCLQTLAMSANRNLSDGFLSNFLPTLNSSHLEMLHLSAVALTPLSAPYIIDYIRSPRSRSLTSLTLNGNSLGYRAIQAIIQAVQEDNYTLIKLEMFSNCFVRPDGANGAPPLEVGEEADEESTSMSSWRFSQEVLKALLWRNDDLAKTVKEEATVLLKYSRPLLLKPKKSVDSDHVVATKAPESGFAKLPTELQLDILTSFAPTLSAAQRIRVFHYASDSRTLPPDPRRLPSLSRDRSTSATGLRLRRSPVGGIPDSAESSGSASQPGARTLWPDVEARLRWLKVVGCEAYEKGPR